MDATLREPDPNAAMRSAAPLSGVIRCTGCQRENPPQRRFCRGCGQGLWDRCPQCGAELPVDERFCGQCGADVRGLVEEQQRHVRERLDRAAEMAAEHHYESALNLLRSVAALDDPKMENFARQAQAKIERLEAHCREARASAAAAKANAACLLKDRKFDQAAALLAAVPQPLRDDEAAALLDQAKFFKTELSTLLAEIRQAVEQKRSGNLFPKIERVLTLKPDHQGILELAGRLRDQFARKAEQRLAEHRYEEAAGALLTIPEAFCNAVVLKLLDKAQELAALLDDVQHTPYVTPQAVALAKRLARLAAADESVVKICEQLQARGARGSADRGPIAIPWAAPPESTALGLPVDWLTDLPGANCDKPEVGQALRQHPGELLVAMGLALAGLQANPPLNLMPRPGSGVLGKLAAIRLPHRSTGTAWGIDLGSYALKAVKLASDRTGSITVEGGEYIPLRRPGTNADESERRAIAVEALKELASRVKLEGERVVAAIPAQCVLGRFFELPPLPAAKLASAVEYEARRQIPIDLADLCWAWELVAEPNRKEAEGHAARVTVAAARARDAVERIELFQSAGIRVHAMPCAATALRCVQRMLKKELGRTPPADDRDVAIVDIGAGGSQIVISGPSSFWFRSFPLGGESLTAALAERFQVTRDAAESLKRAPASARRFYQFREALEPIFARIAGEIERSLAAYESASGGWPVTRLWGTGGAFQAHALLRYLRCRFRSVRV